MIDSFALWIRIFIFLLVVTAIIYYIWLRKQMKRKHKKAKGKAIQYSLTQMKEIK